MFLSATTVSEVPGVEVRETDPFSPLPGSTDPIVHE
jgi:hypothetical protein